ncbi:hypothetical protein HYFRA_00007153 [Hymenoscyphus fraxineus]|uniref:Bifunctional lycopene cyclase/phytoene synthase n=1 Tax=Hymenoscyphus fraxineus TaxID=746836 RepID=A0A9N9KYY4_9HELO|nr:hypothetical protein HYFRA_00007153 [Hymenoscyphus fraxineus]
MGFEYAFVHLAYTIPPAVVLTTFYRPLSTAIDIYKIAFLIAIAVVSTTPWDSYLISRNIWTYPPSVIIGPRLFLIPIEELFFFGIQTYNTSLLYLLLSKPVFHPIYLRRKSGINQYKLSGQILLVSSIILGVLMVRAGKEGTYLGLILVWAGPFALLLFCLSSQFILTLPYTSTILPIAIPTIYLWVVDTLALKRGTWAIQSGTKLGIYLWDGLEIEEAIFFLATNVLIVFGQIAFDHALAILQTFPLIFPEVSELPSPLKLVAALLTDRALYDEARLEGLQQAVERLRNKSRSFYIASSTFSGRLRTDLILLYSFCRVADDLVDNSKGSIEARQWIQKLTQYLDMAYKEGPTTKNRLGIETYINDNFPAASRSALYLLPTSSLPAGPLFGLLEGFVTDLEFDQNFPIGTPQDLRNYASHVAGTVAELVLNLVFFHSHAASDEAQRKEIMNAGHQMGIALQYVNIARDIATDAAIGRVYLPTAWLEDKGLTPQDVLKDPRHPSIEIIRTKLLKEAFGIYEKSRGPIELLPENLRAPIRVCVESYMEIGRVLREDGYVVKEGKATIPRFRRLKVAWKALTH